MSSLWQFLFVMLGGAIGTGARFGMIKLFERWAKSPVPLATLSVNVIGSYLVTLISVVALSSTAIGANTRLFLTVGIMGGLTTYSSFNNDLVDAVQRGDHGAAFLNFSLTVVLCLIAGFLGLLTARSLVSAG